MLILITLTPLFAADYNSLSNLQDKSFSGSTGRFKYSSGLNHQSVIKIVDVALLIAS